MATFAPSGARRFAMAEPMSRDPPVISAIFPFNYLVIIFSPIPRISFLLPLLGFAASLDVVAPPLALTLLGWDRYFASMGAEMELRHLRLFRGGCRHKRSDWDGPAKLHTSQPFAQPT